MNNIELNVQIANSSKELDLQKNCNYGECTDADSLRYLLGKIIYVPFHPNSGYGRIIVKSIIRILLPNATTLKIYLNLKSGLIIPLGKRIMGNLRSVYMHMSFILSLRLVISI